MERGMVDELTVASLGELLAPYARRAEEQLDCLVPEPGVPEALSEAGVYVSIRGSSLRVTPHLWNDEADRSALFEVLKRTL